LNTKTALGVTYIDHHGPKQIPIICQIPDPPTYSLVPAFKGLTKGSRTVHIIAAPLCHHFTDGLILLHYMLLVPEFK
jgi:hypothetical protein